MKDRSNTSVKCLSWVFKAYYRHVLSKDTVDASVASHKIPQVLLRLNGMCIAGSESTTIFLLLITHSVCLHISCV